MRGIGDSRAIAALTRSGENLFHKCFSRNSFSGPGGRGRGAGVGVPPREPIGATASESEDTGTSSIGVGRGQVIDANQLANEIPDDGVVEWRETVQRRISLMDLQNKAGDCAATGRGRGIGLASAPKELVEGRELSFPPTQSGASPGISRGRGIPVVPPQSAGRGRGIPLPRLAGVAGRDIPHSPLGSSLGLEKVQNDTIDIKEEDSEVIASPSEAESPTPDPPRIFFSPQITLPSMGRGRGQIDEVLHPTIGAEQDMRTQFQRDRGKARTVKRTSPTAKQPQLTADEARARAIAILEEGIEKNVAADGDRRRKAGMEKFADATEFFADRFKREPGHTSLETQGAGKEKERRKRIGRPRGPRTVDGLAVAESPVEEQLTPEEETELLRIDNESTFKENLHRLFLVQFEPEYAMEEFGRNPDVDEPPVLSLEEYLHRLKPMFLQDNAELSEEQKWQEAVQQSIANAPQLEKLVEAYAGRGRMTARQQIQKLEGIRDKLPKSVPSQVSAFTQRALITLQNNPRLTFQLKERLMNNIISGFSSL